MSIQVLYCTTRRNAHNIEEEIITVRFCIKYYSHDRTGYFFVTGKNRHPSGDGHVIVEFYAFDRVFDDKNAIDKAKKNIRGHPVDAEKSKLYYTDYKESIEKMVHNYYGILSRRPIHHNVEYYIEGTDMTMSDTDTISDTNLSECSGDTENDVKDECLDKVREFLLTEVLPSNRRSVILLDFDIEVENIDYENELGIRDESLTDSITFNMLISKYKNTHNESELRKRRLAMWLEKSELLRDYVDLIEESEVESEVEYSDTDEKEEDNK